MKIQKALEIMGAVETRFFDGLLLRLPRTDVSVHHELKNKSDHGIFIHEAKAFLREKGMANQGTHWLKEKVLITVWFADESNSHEAPTEHEAYAAAVIAVGEQC